MATSIRDISITGLQNAHALEAQAIQLCQRQVERLENYPEMREHVEESRRQQERIDQIPNQLGSSPSKLKDIGTSIMGNMPAIRHAAMQDEVIKNTFANYAFEHFEIASYRAVMEMAQAAGDNASPPLSVFDMSEKYADVMTTDECEAALHSQTSKAAQKGALRSTRAATTRARKSSAASATC